MNINKPIGWGMCTVIIKDLDVAGAKWLVLATPKENSTTLTPTKGDKKEATIEGGENEDVKYGKNKYALVYTIRRNTDRKKPMKDVDGIVEHRYAVFVQPENYKVPGPKIDLSVVSLEDPFDTTDGGQLTYTHDALKPASGNTVKWVKCSKDLSQIVEGTEIADSELTFTEVDDSAVETPTYTAVSETTGKNPKTEGWYVKDGENYVATTDTTPKTGTTYYVKS